VLSGHRNILRAARQPQQDSVGSFSSHVYTFCFHVCSRFRQRHRRLGRADELVVGGLEDRAGNYNSGDSSRGTVKVCRRREMNREL
jgi:hypothetical protein